MAYESKKDVLIKEEKIGEEYRVAIFQYDEGEKKIVIQKSVEFKDKNSGEDIKSWTNKVGRMKKDIAEQVIEAMQKFLSEI